MDVRVTRVDAGVIDAVSVVVVVVEAIVSVKLVIVEMSSNLWFIGLAQDLREHRHVRFYRYRVLRRTAQRHLPGCRVHDTRDLESLVALFRAQLETILGADLLQTAHVEAVEARCLAHALVVGVVLVAVVHDAEDLEAAVAFAL